MKLFKRHQYLNKECTHHEYYAQYCTPEIIEMMGKEYGFKVDKQGDPLMPSVSHCDGLTNAYLTYSTKMKAMFKERGDYLTLAGGTCLFKTAIRIWRMNQ